jgi:hypothetical protein
MTFRKWCHDRLGVWWHAQNLSDHGPMWRYGRAWLRWSRGDANTGHSYRPMLEVNPEWNVAPRASAGLSLQLGGGDGNTDIQLSVDVGLARAYLTFDSPLWKPWLERILPGYWIERHGTYQHFDEPGPNRLKITQETEIAVKWHGGGLWWSLWHSTMEWKSSTPKWRNGHFDPADFLLGRHKYSSEELSTENVEVPMPERMYPGTVTLTRDTWKRPRWPFSRSMYRANIEVEGGVPHPGKGENSWDCGEDATYSLTCKARTAEEAVGKLVGSVLSSRRRYGGRNWRPRELVA